MVASGTNTFRTATEKTVNPSVLCFTMNHTALAAAIASGTRLPTSATLVAKSPSASRLCTAKRAKITSTLRPLDTLLALFSSAVHSIAVRAIIGCGWLFWFNKRNGPSLLDCTVQDCDAFSHNVLSHVRCKFLPSQSMCINPDEDHCNHYYDQPTCKTHASGCGWDSRSGRCRKLRLRHTEL
jgi:hypothetical protein